MASIYIWNKHTQPENPTYPLKSITVYDEWGNYNGGKQWTIKGDDFSSTKTILQVNSGSYALRIADFQLNEGYELEDNEIRIENRAGTEIYYSATVEGFYKQGDPDNDWYLDFTVVKTSSNIPVTGVTLDPTEATLTVGKTLQLTATVEPFNATNKNVQWGSNKTSVATVSSSGVVTAKSPGEATITVITSDGSKMATCKVTVEEKTIDCSFRMYFNHSPSGGGYSDIDPEINSVKLSYGSNGSFLSYDGYDMSQIKTFSVTPGTVFTLSNIGWNEAISSNKDSYIEGCYFAYAAISACWHTLNGGNTKYSWTKKGINWFESPLITSEGNYLIDCELDLWLRRYINGLSVSDKSENLNGAPSVQINLDDCVSYIYKNSNTGIEGETPTITYSINSYDVNGAKPTLSSSKLTFKGAGKAQIKATTTPGYSDAKPISVYFNVTVTDTVAVESVSLDKTSAEIEKDKTLTLTATVLPTNATNKNVTWYSSNTSVATVSNGVVTAINPGSTTITVTTEDGRKTASCLVTVYYNMKIEIFVEHSLPGDKTANVTVNSLSGDSYKSGFNQGAISNSKMSLTKKITTKTDFDNLFKTQQWILEIVLPQNTRLKSKYNDTYNQGPVLIKGNSSNYQPSNQSYSIYNKVAKLLFNAALAYGDVIDFNLSSSIGYLYVMKDNVKKYLTVNGKKLYVEIPEEES